MFEKDSERRIWARDRMREAKVQDRYYAVVERLLDVYWPFAMQNELDPKSAEEVLRIFTELAQGHALLPDVEEEEFWVPAKPGNLTFRDTVRVRKDAYDGPAGVAHNGRRAAITAIRNGDVHVKYKDNRMPEISRHLPYALEKLVRR